MHRTRAISPRNVEADRLPATMRQILSKSLTVRGFINNQFAAEHYPEFLREVGAGIAEDRFRYREDIVDGLGRASEAFIGMLDGRNFGKLIVRVSLRVPLEPRILLTRTDILVNRRRTEDDS